MNFQEILSFLQQAYPNFVVRDHGAGGHIEMIGETTDKNGNPLLLFGWNEESLSVIRDYQDFKRFLTKEDFLFREDHESIWESQYEGCWKPLFTHDFQGNIETNALTYALFSEKTVESLHKWFEQLILVHKMLTQFTYQSHEEKTAYLRLIQRSIQKECL